MIIVFILNRTLITLGTRHSDLLYFARPMRGTTKHLFHLIRALCVILSFSSLVWAHDTRPTVVEISEGTGGRYSVQWRVPDSMLATDVPEVVMPANCRNREMPSHPRCRW